MVSGMPVGFEWVHYALYLLILNIFINALRRVYLFVLQNMILMKIEYEDIFRMVDSKCSASHDHVKGVVT